MCEDPQAYVAAHFTSALECEQQLQQLNAGAFEKAAAEVISRFVRHYTEEMICKL